MYVDNHQANFSEAYRFGRHDGLCTFPSRGHAVSCSFPPAWFESSGQVVGRDAVRTNGRQAAWHFGSLFYSICRFPRDVADRIVALHGPRLGSLIRQRLRDAGNDIHHRFGQKAGVLADLVVEQRNVYLFGAIDSCTQAFGSNFVFDSPFHHLQNDFDHEKALQKFLASKT